VYVALAETLAASRVRGGHPVTTGLVGLSIVQGYETTHFGLAQDGRFDLATLAVAIDDLTIPPAIPMIIMLLGVLGLLGMAVALWRSGAVPRAAVLLNPVFVIVDFFLQQGLAGHVIQFVAACWIAWVVLRPGEALQADGDMSCQEGSPTQL
jgi:hypothetical protein